MLIQVEGPVAAASGSDLLVNSIHRLSSYDRYITGGILAGKTGLTAGAGDLYIGDVNVASLEAQVQTSTGYAMFPIDSDVPAGAEMRFILTTPIAGGAAILTLQIDEVEDDEMDLEGALDMAMA